MSNTVALTDRRQIRRAMATVKCESLLMSRVCLCFTEIGWLIPAWSLLRLPRKCSQRNADRNDIPTMKRGGEKPFIQETISYSYLSYYCHCCLDDHETCTKYIAFKDVYCMFITLPNGNKRLPEPAKSSFERNTHYSYIFVLKSHIFRLLLNQIEAAVSCFLKKDN